MRYLTAIPVAAVVAIALAVSVMSTPVQAETWYVQAGSAPPWLGTKKQPFNTLAQVEANSGPGDRIFVLPASSALDGGLRLKDGQKLTGLGPEVTELADPGLEAHAQITNTTSGHLGGDAIRLADNNTVANVHIAGAYRSGILGINVVSPTIKDNLITENMIQHGLQVLQDDFVIFEPQRNHYAAITLFACGFAVANECVDEDPSTPGIADTGQVVIKGNEIRDSNVEGIVLLNDSGVIATYKVKDNYVHHLSQGLGDPAVILAVPEVVRSRGFTMITGNGSDVKLDMDEYVATHLAPAGDYASDGVVIVGFGDNAMVTADITDVLVTNPDGTGEAINGDSLEFSHFGSHSTFDVRVKRADLRDSVSTLIKLLEVGPVTGNSIYFRLEDSILTNVNPRANVDPARGAITYVKIPAPGVNTVDTLDLTVKNTVMSGHKRGIHILNLAGTENPVDIGTMNVLVAHSTFSDLTNEGFRIFNQGGAIGSANIDLGEGPLGSAGHNSFTNNGFAADVAVVNLNFAGPPINVFASKNFWGGGAPVQGLGANFFGVGPANFIAPKFLAKDPSP